MQGDVTDRKLMLQQQGKRVRVMKSDGSAEWALTIVHVVDESGRSLRLCNRDSKSHKPDWALSQKLWEAIAPAEPAETAQVEELNCAYELVVK